MISLIIFINIIFRSMNRGSRWRNKKKQDDFVVKSEDCREDQESHQVFLSYNDFFSQHILVLERLRIGEMEEEH